MENQVYENQVYTLEDYSNIIFSGFNYTLDPGVLAIIQDIADKVGAPEYIRTPQFQKSASGSRPRRNKTRPSDISDQDWENIRKFQATDLGKREGIDAAIDKVRILLNKTTKSNIDAQKEIINDEVQKILSDEDSLDNLQKVSEVILTIASGNEFYSALYADLYKYLLDNNALFNSTLTEEFSKFSSLFDNIEWCDPNENYDRFCEINKQNDNRRAITLFYVNLMKRDIISRDSIVNIIKQVQCQLLADINKDNCTPIVEVLSELIGLMVLGCIMPEEDWDTEKSNEWVESWSSSFEDILDNVYQVASSKAKSYPSLSNKTVFKHMDIRDAINKLKE